MFLSSSTLQARVPLARSNSVLRLSWILLVVGLPLWAHAADPAPSDNFADRPTFTILTGDLTGNSSAATREIDEPIHGGKPGGKSVWISWTAPANGIATFHTDGSDFDTLLSAYRISPGNTPELKRLQEVARNDDNPALAPSSIIQFGALAGTRYEIALDGRNGASGNFHLKWEFQSVSKPPPIILSTPEDRALKLGDRLEMTVNFVSTDSLKFSWFLNEGEIAGSESPTLIIPSLSTDDLGRYRLRIHIGDVRFFTAPIEIQVNSEGFTNALARDKLFDALDSPFESDDHHGGPHLQDLGVGVTRGFNGTQIFNTLYSTRDPSEPVHCGVGGGSSYWFAYSPPQDGQVYLDTVGSSYDTVLAIYTYTGTLTSYADLQEIACNNNGVGLGTASSLDFAALGGHQYLVVIDGVAGARGTAHLNYRVDVLQIPAVPQIQTPPPEKVALPGDTIRLQITASGSPPLRYLWAFGNTPMPQATNASFTLSNFQAANQGDYTVRVFSHIGSTNAPPIHVSLLVPPPLSVVPSGSNGVIRAFLPVGATYQLEYKDSLESSDWLPWGEPFPGANRVLLFTNFLSGSTSRFYRIRP